MLWAPGDTDRQLHAAEHFPQAGHGSVQTIAAPTSTSAGAITNHATKTGPPEWLSMCVVFPGVCVRARAFVLVLSFCKFDPNSRRMQRWGSDVSRTGPVP